MRSILERGDMTYRNFFTAELLTATFGGSSVECSARTPQSLSCAVLGLDYLHVGVETSWNPKLEVGWDEARSTVPGKPYSASFSVSCRCNLRSEAIEAVFGNLDRTVKPNREREGTHSPQLPRPTHPLGNQIARYMLDGPEGYVTFFEVRYDYQGKVQLMIGQLHSLAEMAEREVQK